MVGEKETLGRFERFVNAFLTAWEVLKSDSSPPPSDTTIDVYYETLRPYQIEDIEKAFSAALGMLRWFPKPVELKDFIKASNSNYANIQVRAQQQWRAVVSAVRSQGARRRPKFVDPITEHLIDRQFSWSYLCEMSEVNENWEQKRWCEAYELADSIRDDLLTNEMPQKVIDMVDKVAKSISWRKSK